MLASTSADFTVRLWQVSDGSLIAKMEGHTQIVQDLAFSPNGQYLVSGSYDRTIRIWWLSEWLEGQ